MPALLEIFGCLLHPGDHGGGVTPVPIPNTAVKPSSADGTARAAWWESRTLPGFFDNLDATKTEPSDLRGLLFFQGRVASGGGVGGGSAAASS